MSLWTKRGLLLGNLGLLLLAAGCPPPSALERAYGLHGEAAAAGDPALLAQAEEAYAEHARGCPLIENCQDACVRLGQVRMELQDFDGAAEAFRMGAEVEGDQARTAAIGQLEALETWLKIPPQGRGVTRWSKGPPLIDSERPPSPQDQPLPLDPVEQRLVAAADLLLEVDPSYDGATALRYQAAFLLYQRRHYDPASGRFMKLAQDDPGSSEARSAVRMLLSTHHARQAWGALVRDGAFFLALDGLDLGEEERANLADMVDEARAQADTP